MSDKPHLEETTMKPIPALSQRDPRWKDKKLGTSNETIGDYGCLLVDLTMVANYYGFQITPDTLNKKMRNAGAFRGAFIIPRLISSVLPGMRQKRYVKLQGGAPAPLHDIDAALAQGHPVIVEVDYSPKPGFQNHWVVLYQKQGKDYLIRDPWPYPPEEDESTLREQYGFAGKPAKIIRSVLWMEGPLQEAPPAEPPEDTIASFPLFAMVDDLALRSQPVVAPTTLIKRVARNTRFDVLTSDEEASNKIGVMGEWLPVRDPEGTRGYTAAWYLSREEQPIIPPPEGPPQEDVIASFPVYAVVDDLALRSRPIIAEDTLIKRVPRNTRFAVLTNDEEAHRKTGTAGEWLPVRDPEGTRGYVAAWCVAKQPQQVAQPPAPPPSSPATLQVRTTVEGLSFRSRPRIMPDTLLRRLPFHTVLTVLEEEARALPKIGALNQWLHVETENGQRGYVAAWYVERAPQSVPPPTEEPGGTLTIHTSVDNLALRSLPHVAEDTLLKRLPLGAPLLVLENTERARTKIGQFGQWLLVRDAAGSEGYVAAWYVT